MKRPFYFTDLEDVRTRSQVMTLWLLMGKDAVPSQAWYWFHELQSGRAKIRFEKIKVGKKKKKI